MIGATKRQQQIMNFIARYTRTNGYPPTYEEIAQAFGFRSVNSVDCHVRAMSAKGLVTHEKGKPRTLKVMAR